MKRQAAALLASASILALSHTSSLAQTGYFSGFFGFGDSLTDNGRIAREANGYSPTGTIDALRSTHLYQASRWSNAPGYFELLPGLIGTRYVPGNDFAIGGAQAVHQDPNALLSPTFAWGVPDQINDFTARQGRFGPRDLVLLWIGYNDLSLISTTAPAQPRADRVTSILNNNVTALNGLVSLGARELLVFNQQTFRGSNRDLAASFNAQFPTYLAPLAASGVNVHYFDVDSLLTRFRADPTKFGYIAAAATGNCSADPACAPIGYLNGGAAENQYISVDGVHLTGKTNTYIAAFVSNQLNAPLTVAPQTSLATGAGNAFSTTLLDRLDAYRRVNVGGMTSSQVALPVKAPGGSVPISAWSPVSIFAEGIYARKDSSGQGVDALAFGADFGGLNAGIEYRFSPNVMVGAAFNFLNTTANLTGPFRSQTGFDAFQGGVFASLSYPNFFADGAITFGANRYNLSRPGVFDTITASTDGGAFTAAGKAGYLFDWGMFRAGPIAGLSYANVRVNGYTESGDPLLTMTVQGQSLEGLTGSAGAQFRALLPAGSMPLNAFLNLTAEHDFLDQVHIIGSALTSAPAFLIRTTLGGGQDTVYGKVAGGFSTEIGGGFSATFTGSTTFARPDGNDHTLSAGLKYRFGAI